MSEFQDLLKPYDLESSQNKDMTNDSRDCVTIQIESHPTASNEPVLRLPQAHTQTTKLYVVGELGTGLSLHYENLDKWARILDQVCHLISEMSGLQELTWISPLAFNAKIWEVLPKSLTKLIIDIRQPVNIIKTSIESKVFISQDDMKPLVRYTKLRELRVFGMRDSFQALLWEVVYRNQSDDRGMHVLDLEMATAPFVRQDNWIKGTDVRGLKVPVQDPTPYKGLDGKGILDYNYGTGEYIDDYCIRKARIASGIDDTKPLPLWCLKLDGFVIDNLPFKEELSHVVLLTCGNNCVDAGLRAPRERSEATRNKWGPSVASEQTHCFIAWPNWQAIFDNKGRLLDNEGNVIPEAEADNNNDEA